MPSLLSIEYEEDSDVQSYSETTLEKLTFDNWLDSGYRLVLPEKGLWSSDDY
jgi:hypothetical protein